MCDDLHYNKKIVPMDINKVYLYCAQQNKTQEIEQDDFTLQYNVYDAKTLHLHLLH